MSAEFYLHTRITEVKIQLKDLENLLSALETELKTLLEREKPEK